MNKQLINEVRRFQKIAGLLKEEEDTVIVTLDEDDYDMGTPTGDTNAMNIAEDDFSDTSRGLDNTPLP